MLIRNYSATFWWSTWMTMTKLLTNHGLTWWFYIDFLKYDWNKNVSNCLVVVYSTNLPPNITSPTRWTGLKMMIVLWTILFSQYLTTMGQVHQSCMVSRPWHPKLKMLQKLQFIGFCQGIPLYYPNLNSAPTFYRSKKS